MASAASFTDDTNWHGGHYELVLDLGYRNDPDADGRLLRALRAVWLEPDLDGCYCDRTAEPEAQPHIDPPALHLGLPDHLHGRARLPTGARVVCGTFMMRQFGPNGVDWLSFYLPLGSLSRSNDGVGGFPFSSGEGSSRIWREPLDDWLAAMALRLRSFIELRLGLVGFEVLGALPPWRGQVPRERQFGYIVPTARAATFWATTRWDPA